MGMRAHKDIVVSFKSSIYGSQLMHVKRRPHADSTARNANQVCVCSCQGSMVIHASVGDIVGVSAGKEQFKPFAEGVVIRVTSSMLLGDLAVVADLDL